MTISNYDTLKVRVTSRADQTLIENAKAFI